MSDALLLLQVIPPRLTFTNDMTDAEAAIMQEHSAYWSRLLSKGKCVAYGPVLDPDGAYGIAIVEVADEAEHRRERPGDHFRGGLSFRASFDGCDGEATGRERLTQAGVRVAGEIRTPNSLHQMTTLR